MRTKALICLLFLIMLCSNVSISLAAQSNTVSRFDEAEKLGILQGITFSDATKPISKKNFAMMVARVVNLNHEGSIDQVSKELGISNLKSPNGTISRQDAAVLLTKAADLLGRYTYNIPASFKDRNKIGAGAINSVEYVVNRKIMEADSKSNFNPLAHLTIDRAVASVLALYKDDGKLRFTKKQRDEIAADGKKKKAVTRAYEDTEYPKTFLNFDGEYSIELGDVVGYALETDTAVYIDGKYVKSYKVGNMNVIDVDDLATYGYTIKRDTKKKTISIIRKKAAVRHVYEDHMDKRDALVGNTVFTLIANDVRVSTVDDRDYVLGLTPTIPSFTTTSGKILVPVEYLQLYAPSFKKQGNIAFVVNDASNKEIRMYTLSDEDVDLYKDVKIGKYLLADKHPQLTKFLDVKESKVLHKAQEILKQVIQEGMNEFEKEKAIYDYLVSYGEYDWNTFLLDTGEPLDSDFPPANPQAHNVYGSLVDGMAVCDGWSEAYHLLFSLSGLESWMPEGTLYGDSHQWVAVRIDGEWYQVEATIKDESGSPSSYYTNFNFTFEDGVNLLNYRGGDERAVSRKYDYLNKMNRVREPNKSPFEFEEEEAKWEAERSQG